MKIRTLLIGTMLSLLLCACSRQSQASFDTPVTLAVGQTADFGEAKLKLLLVALDTRCVNKANCQQILGPGPGMLSAMAELSSGTGSNVFLLGNMGGKYLLVNKKGGWRDEDLYGATEVNGFYVTLTGASPSPTADEIPADRYRLTFNVSKMKPARQSYSAELTQTGGEFSKKVSTKNWYGPELEVQPFIDSADVLYDFNHGGDLMWVHCADGYQTLHCTSPTDTKNMLRSDASLGCGLSLYSQKNIVRFDCEPK